jgi:hypothetical protein
MVFLEEIDGELHILNENNDVIHVFERARKDGEVVLSRATYKHMCGWVKKNWNAGDDPDEIWIKAEASWDKLDPEQQAYLWNISHQEEQNAKDLCTALLAHLSEYRGLSNVKKAFHNAIKSVLEQFITY